MNKTLMLLVLSALFGDCACVRVPDVGAPQEASSDAPPLPIAEAGGGSAAVHLPVPEGQALHCVQGAHGSFSHDLPSTRYDLDFDTPNDADMEMFAMGPGTAYVHDDPADPFGIHVNVCRSDGTYDVYAHCKRALVATGDDVATGQLLCIEGCTGSCTGDHIHAGRHRGDCSLPAGEGVSIPVSYAVERAGERHALTSEEFSCGLTAQERYASLNATPRGFPGGTLVKSATDARVYRLENGKRRWIVNEDAFYALGYEDFSQVVTVPADALDCYAGGEVLNAPAHVQAAVDPVGDVWLLRGAYDQADRYRVRVPSAHADAVLESWGITQAPSADADDPLMTGWPAVSGMARLRDGTLVSEYGDSTVYAIADGAALAIESWNTFVFLGFQHREILQVPGGTVAGVMPAVGDCAAGEGCFDAAAARACGGVALGGGAPEAPAPEPGEPDLASMLDLDGGEFGLAYAPRENYHPDIMELSGGVTSAEGDTVMAWQTLHEQDHDAPIVYTMPGLVPGDRFVFSVAMGDVGGMQYSCEAGEARGRIYAKYDTQVLDPEVVANEHGGCSLMVTMPGVPEYDPDPPSEEPDDDQTQDPEPCADAGPEGDLGPACQDPEGSADGDASATEGTDDAGTGDAPERTLGVTWTAPFHETMDTITLSGVYLFADGSFGFPWHDLASAAGASSVAYELAGVQAGDTLRFSVEFVREDGSVSWSCIGPYDESQGLYGTTQGTATAHVDGEPVAVTTADDPESMGCGLMLTVP